MNVLINDEKLRIMPRPVAELWQEGLGDKKHEGDKWGGKYLRAPDIFFKVLEKAKDKLARLGEVAELQRGITTGANEFFYLKPTGQPAGKGRLHVRNGAGWEGEIEEKFLVRVVDSTKAIRRLIISQKEMMTLLFSCNLTLTDLKERNFNGALNYIQWGSGFVTRPKGKHTKGGVPLPKTPSLRSRKPDWYCLSPHKPGSFIMPRLFRERFFFADNPDGVCDTDMFFHGYPKEKHREVSALLNSTVVYLFLEILGRHGIEGRFNFYGPELKNIQIINPAILDDKHRNALLAAFNALGNREIDKILDELHKPDRRALDEVVFDLLSLNPSEREEVYTTMAELVKMRLAKAKSIN